MHPSHRSNQGNAPDRHPRTNRAAKIAAARRERRLKANINNDERLGYRLQEFSALIGISVPTLWRRIRQGTINAVSIGGGIKIIPRTEAVRLGLIEPPDFR